MSRSQDRGSMQSYVRHLRFAVATTTCRATVDALQQMLREAEAGLERQETATERVYPETALVHRHGSTEG